MCLFQSNFIIWRLNFQCFLENAIIIIELFRFWFIFAQRKYEDLLFYFLLEISKLLGVKKVNKSYSEAVAEHFYRHDPRVLALAVEDVLDGRRRNC